MDNQRITDDIRTPVISPVGTKGPKGTYSGYICGGCHHPLAVGSVACGYCSRHFPFPTQLHPEQPEPPRDDRPSHVYDMLSSRYVPHVEHEKQQEGMGTFVLIAGGVLIVLGLLFAFVH